MKISDISIKRPVALISILLIAILFGFIGFMDLPVDLLPTMELANISVTTSYPGAGPREVEALVTEVIEKKLSSVSDLSQITSYSYDNYSSIRLKFNDGTNVDDAAEDIREKLDGIENKLPSDADTPKIKKADPNAAPIMRIAISSKSEKKLEEIESIIEDDISSQIQRVEGVASVNTQGYDKKNIEVLLDEEKLYAYDINANSVIQSINKQNIKMPVGTYKKGSSEISLGVDGEFTSIEEIKNLPIQTKNGIVKLSDIASVEEGIKNRESMALVNGHPSITMSIAKQSGANTVEVISGIKDTLESIEKEYPDLLITTTKDDSKVIDSSISSVMTAGIIGGFLAIMILFIFLQNIKSTFIISVAIPISIVITFAIMYFLGVGINMISLMGLSLGIGMLVDNGIVVLENIFRYKNLGYNTVEAATKGVSEVGLAIIASTLTSIAVFLPIVFIEGFAAQIFRDMSLTVTSSLVASLCIALTLVPMLSSKLLGDIDKPKKKPKYIKKVIDTWEKCFDIIENKYKKILEVTLKYKYKTAMASFLILIVTLGVFPALGMEFMPEIDEGVVGIEVKLQNDKLIDETEEVVNEIQSAIYDVEEIESMFIIIDKNEGTLRCDVGERKDRQRSIDEIVNDISQRVRLIPGASISVNSISMSARASGSGEKPLSIEVMGDDYSTLVKISDDFSEIVQGIEGTREVSTSLSNGGLEGIIQIDREKAARYGLSVSSIAGELRSIINGGSPGVLKIDNDDVDITVTYDDAYMDSLTAIRSLPITTSSGDKIPLSEVATISTAPSPSEIKRVDQTRVVSIDAALNGRDINSVKNDVDKKLKEYEMPLGYEYSYGSGISSMMESFASLGIALIISIILIYLIMSAQFESFLYPFIIMFSVPYAMTGGVVALFVTNTALSIVGIIGFIMLVGIVVNNAIVLIEYTNQLRNEGKTLKEALLIAGPVRLKPILMTTLTTVLGMLPLAIGMGQGSEMQVPLARVIVGGLSLSTLVTLIIIPINYMILEELLTSKKNKKSQA